MRSALRCFSRFALSLLFCCAITTPRIALAEWFEPSASMYSYNQPPGDITFKRTPVYDTGTHAFTDLIEISWSGNYGTRDAAVWNTKPTSTTSWNVVSATVSPATFASGAHFQVDGIAQIGIYYTTVASPASSDYNIKYLSCNYYSVWVQNAAGDEPIRVYADGNGAFKCPFDVACIYLCRRFQVADLPMANGRYWKLGLKPKIFAYRGEDYNEVEAIEQQTTDIGMQTQQQTETLMDVSGAGGVLDGANGVTNTINSKLGFVSQSASMVTSLYDAILGQDATTTVRFPGIQFGSYVIVSPQDVQLLGWMPEVENTVKLFLTGVFVFAWLSGVRKLYGKFFLGEQEVIIDGDGE